MGQSENIQLVQMSSGGVLQQAISAVAEIGVADHIDRGGVRPVSELASELGCDERSLYRCLRFLASHGVFEEKSEGSFALSPLAEALRSDADDSFRAGARLFGICQRAIGELEHSIRTGRSGFSKAYGAEIFPYLNANAELAPVFDAGMSAVHGSETPAMLQAFDFSGIEVLADVGGGNGSLMMSTLHHYPELKGMVYDLGHVVERTRNNVAAAGLSDRCQVVEGDFFKAFPQGADAYLMRHIIHDWTDEQCVQILKNCREVIPANGRLFVVEMVIPEGNDPSPAKDFDMVMMLVPGGMERTEKEYRELFRASGFELTGVTPTPSPVSVVEGRPV